MFLQHDILIAPDGQVREIRSALHANYITALLRIKCMHLEIGRELEKVATSPSLVPLVRQTTSSTTRALLPQEMRISIFT